MPRAAHDSTAGGVKDDLSPTKISAPQLRDWLPRQRLYRTLDGLCAKHRVVWVSAPPGSGKTYLLTSYIAQRRTPCLWYQVDAGDRDLASFVYYFGLAVQRASVTARSLPVLTPEYAAGREVFTHNFFREAFHRLPKPGLVLLDNYQDAPADSLLHESLSIAVSELPEGLTLVVLSRGEPPAELARERIHGRLGALTDRDLRLERREIATLAQRYDVGELDAGRGRQLYAETHGWFAGVVLLLSRLEAAPELGPRIEGENRALVFDYFASQIFDCENRATREFLLETAFLSPMSAEDAGALTGYEDAEARLEWLVRNHYFVVRVGGSPPAYRYHPLFERFLRARARQTWPAEKLHGTVHRAARQAAASGRTEHAVALLLESGAWEALGALLIDAAPALLAQGRHESLEQWLNRVPDDEVWRFPWLSYWLAMSRLYSDPAAARELLAAAYERFKEQGDAHGSYAAWTGVVNSILLAMDRLEAARGGVALATGLLPVRPAVAHHSAGAVFDAEQSIELTGTVTKVEWMNPHVWFYVEAKGAGGDAERWAFEMASPNGLMRRGWRRDSLEAGDVVTVVGARARDGSPRAAARSVMLAHGERLFTGQNLSQ